MILEIQLDATKQHLERKNSISNLKQYFFFFFFLKKKKKKKKKEKRKKSCRAVLALG
jgi:hypothetical protein